VGDARYYDTNDASHPLLLYTTEEVQPIEDGIEATIRETDVANDQYMLRSVRWQRGQLIIYSSEVGTGDIVELDLPLEEGRSWNVSSDASDGFVYRNDATIISVDSTLELQNGDVYEDVVVVRQDQYLDSPFGGESYDTTFSAFAYGIGPVQWRTGNSLIELDSYHPAEADSTP
jgi:hypothetical protein